MFDLWSSSGPLGWWHQPVEDSAVATLYRIPLPLPVVRFPRTVISHPPVSVDVKGRKVLSALLVLHRLHRARSLSILILSHKRLGRGGHLDGREGRGLAGAVDGVEDGKEEERRQDKDKIKPLVVKLELDVTQHLPWHASPSAVHAIPAHGARARQCASALCTGPGVCPEHGTRKHVTRERLALALTAATSSPRSWSA